MNELNEFLVKNRVAARQLARKFWELGMIKDAVAAYRIGKPPIHELLQYLQRLEKAEQLAREMWKDGVRPKKRKVLAHELISMLDWEHGSHFIIHLNEGVFMEGQLLFRELVEELCKEGSSEKQTI